MGGSVCSPRLRVTCLFASRFVPNHLRIADRTVRASLGFLTSSSSQEKPSVSKVLLTASVIVVRQTKPVRDVNVQGPGRPRRAERSRGNPDRSYRACT